MQCAFGIVFFSVIILLSGNFRTAVMVFPIDQNIELSFPAEALISGGLAELFMGLCGVLFAGNFFLKKCFTKKLFFKKVSLLLELKLTRLV